MKVDKALLWQYTDGTCSEEERQVVEKALAEDAEWQQAFQATQQVDKLLQERELEEPSMRFTQNVMDKLPQLYSRLAKEPLLQKRWWKWTLGTVSFLFAAVTLLIFSVNNALIPELPMARTTQSFIQDSTVAVLSQTSTIFWTLLLSASLSIVLLFWMDRYFKKQLRNKKSEVSKG